MPLVCPFISRICTCVCVYAYVCIHKAIHRHMHIYVYVYVCIQYARSTYMHWLHIHTYPKQYTAYTYIHTRKLSLQTSAFCMANQPELELWRVPL